MVPPRRRRASVSGYHGDVNSYLWLVNVVHAFDAIVKSDLEYVFESDELAEDFDCHF